MAGAVFKRPDYPDILLQKSWDKKKSILSGGVKTGVGETMKEAKSAYDKVDWDKLELLGHFHGNSFNVQEWKGRLEAAISEAYGPLMKFSQALDAVRDKAEAAAKIFSERKTSPKSDVKLAKDTAWAADVLAGQMNKNVVRPVLQAIHDECKETMDRTVAMAKPSLKKALVGLISALKDMQNDPTPETFNKKQVEARKVTQWLGNAKRFVAMGYDIGMNTRQTDELFEEMSDWANGKVQLSLEGAEDRLEEELKKMIGCIKRASLLAA